MMKWWQFALYDTLSTMSAILRHLLRGCSLFLIAGLLVSGISLFLPGMSADDTGLPGIQTAHANPDTVPADGVDPALTVLGAVNGLVKMLFMLANPILMICSWLLSPDWTYGDVFSMRSILYNLWILVSNIVYIVFAIMLVVMAFMNIFGSESYQLKTMLPRFVGGIILVPLSWFIVSAVLSISNILTAAVLNLPYDTFMNVTASASSSLDPEVSNDVFAAISNIKAVPEQCTLNLKRGGEDGESEAESDAAVDCGEQSDWRTVGEFFNSSDSPYSVIYLYAYGIFRVDQIQKITGTNIPSISSTGDLIFGVGLAVVVFIVLMILIVGIVFVLFTRAMYLWVFAILSPLFGLFFFLGKDKAPEALKSWSLESFISLAMVPVYIAAALSFGLMFLLVVQTTEITDNPNAFIATKGYEGQPDKQTIIFNQAGDYPIEFTIEGLPVGLQPPAGSADVTTNEADGIGLGFIGHIITMILALFILWLAVMAGAESSEITKNAISPIRQFGESMGKLVTQWAQYVRVPIPGTGQSISYSGMQTLGSTLQSRISARWTDTGSDLASYMLGEGWDVAEIKKAARRIDRPWTDNNVRREAWAVLRQMGHSNDWRAEDIGSRYQEDLRRIRDNFVNSSGNWLNSQEKEELEKMTFGPDKPEEIRRLYGYVHRTFRTRWNIEDSLFGKNVDNEGLHTKGNEGTFRRLGQSAPSVGSASSSSSAATGGAAATGGTAGSVTQEVSSAVSRNQWTYGDQKPNITRDSSTNNITINVTKADGSDSTSRTFYADIIKTADVSNMKSRLLPFAGLLTEQEFQDQLTSAGVSDTDGIISHINATLWSWFFKEATP